MGASTMSQRLKDHGAKVQASSEPGQPRPVPGAVKASAAMTRAGTKLLSKTAGKVHLVQQGFVRDWVGGHSSLEQLQDSSRGVCCHLLADTTARVAVHIWWWVHTLRETRRSN